MKLLFRFSVHCRQQPSPDSTYELNPVFTHVCSIAEDMHGLVSGRDIVFSKCEIFMTFIALKEVYGMYHSLNIRYCNIVFVRGKEGLSVKQ